MRRMIRRLKIRSGSITCFGLTERAESSSSTPNGDCHFLGPQGCTLASTVRPLICRLYPFDYTVDGIKERPAGGCPVELLRPQQQLLQVLGMDRDEAERYRAQLYAELPEQEDSDAASESVAA